VGKEGFPLAVFPGREVDLHVLLGAEPEVAGAADVGAALLVDEELVALEMFALIEGARAHVADVQLRLPCSCG